MTPVGYGGRVSWRALAVLLLPSCAPPMPAPPAHEASAALKACAAAGRRVTSVERALESLDALPHPVDGPCFVASLPRPLKVVASASVVSAQPALNRESPRLFLLLDGVVATVVPEGDGAAVLEFGQWTTATRTIKAEVALPVLDALPADAAHRHVLNSRGTGTTCGLCHTSEREERPGVFSSTAYRPQRRDEVAVSALVTLHERCVRDGDEAGACAMLHALFDFGAVAQAAFDPALETFGP